MNYIYKTFPCSFLNTGHLTTIFYRQRSNKISASIGWTAKYFSNHYREIEVVFPSLSHITRNVLITGALLNFTGYLPYLRAVL